jgi:hypothetical protein
MKKISLRDALDDTENPVDSLARYLMDAPPEVSSQVSSQIGDDWIRWPSVAKLATRKYGNTDIYLEAQAAAEHQILVRDLRQTFSDRLREAQKSVTGTMAALTELVSDEIYDAEFAEGAAGDDLHFRLDQVARDLRCIRAIFTAESG